jgi:hypothetical protein
MATAAGNGDPGGTSFQSGSYGYDISNYQCGDFPPAPHAIGVVEVEGASFGTVNPCLAQEVSWAGGGLNLYLFLTFGTATTSADTACATTATPKACNYGYKAAIYAYTKAAAVIPDPAVGWWLDIEGTTTYWSATTAANASLIQGAIDALSDTEGLNQVGIYTSGGVWPAITGKNYKPSVLYWAADWARKPSFTFEAGDMNTAYDNDYAC